MSHQNAGEDNLAAMTNAWSAMTRGFLRTATAANRAAVSAMLPPTDGESSAETTGSPRRSRRSTTPISIGSSTVPSTIRTESASAIPSPSRRPSPRRTSGRSPRSAATRTDSTSTRSSRPRPALAGASSTGPSSPVSSAPRWLGSPDSPSTSPRTSSSAPCRYRRPRLRPRGDRRGSGNDQYRLETLVRDEDDDATVIDGEAVVLIDDLPAE